MDKYFDFLEKIIDDYNKNHKEVVSEKFWMGEYKLLDYLEKYNRMEQLTEVYRRLFITYQEFITDLPIYGAKDIKGLFGE